jgi:hypothetical protein
MKLRRASNDIAAFQRQNPRGFRHQQIFPSKIPTRPQGRSQVTH